MLARVALDTRPGPSARGGELARLRRRGADAARARALALDRPRDARTLAARAGLARADGRRAGRRVADRARSRTRCSARRARSPTRSARRSRRGEPLAEPDPDDERRLAILDAELGADAGAGDRAALRPPPPRALRLGLGERALGPRRRLPRRPRGPARRAPSAAAPRVDRLAAHAATSRRSPRPRAGSPRRRRRRRGRPGRRRRARARIATAVPRPAPTARRPRRGDRAGRALGSAARRPDSPAAGRAAARGPARVDRVRRRAGRRRRRRHAPRDSSRPRVGRAGRARPRPSCDSRSRRARRSLDALARPARRDGARHRRGARLDRRRARRAACCAAARRSSSRPRPTRPSGGASTATCTARAAGPGRRAARPAREPRVVRRRRRARGVAARSPAAAVAAAPTCASTRCARRSLAPFAAIPTDRRRDRRRRRASRPRCGCSCSASQRLVGAIAAARRRPAVLLPSRPTTARSAATARTARRRPRSRCCSRAAQRAVGGEHARLVAPRIGWVRGTGLMGAQRRDRAARRGAARRAHVRRRRDGLAADGPHDASRGAARGSTPHGGLVAHSHDLRGALAAARRRAARALRPRRRAATGSTRELAARPPPARPSRRCPAPGTDAAPAPVPRRAADHAPRPRGPRRDRRHRRARAGRHRPQPLRARARRARLAGRRRRAGVAVRPRALRARALPRALDRRGDAATRCPRSELAARYADAVARRVGVRAARVRRRRSTPTGTPCSRRSRSSASSRFEVAREERGARVRGAGAHDVRRDGERWRVDPAPGAQIRVPRIVAAHAPRRRPASRPGLDLARFGVPSDLIASADRMALVNLACTVEAFADAGLEPEELLGERPPRARRQHAGRAAWAGWRRCGACCSTTCSTSERQNDRLQESLGNVVAAHAVQTYVGSYGPMIHPVGACATAAVSLEVALRQDPRGKALAVLAGGFDDLTPEGMHRLRRHGRDRERRGPRRAWGSRRTRRRGPTTCGARASSRPRAAERSSSSAATSRSRSGCRCAACSPTRSSFADGLHTLDPGRRAGRAAPAARRRSREALARHGLTADDIAVVSKHDTSTEMNDPTRPTCTSGSRRALGRTPGNPLLVVSQKTVTGHAKGGAAAWQLDGVLRMLERGVVPGNRNLESVDPLDARQRLPDPRRPPDRARRADPRRADRVASASATSRRCSPSRTPTRSSPRSPRTPREDYLRRAGRRRAEGVRRRPARPASGGRRPCAARRAAARPRRRGRAASSTARDRRRRPRRRPGASPSSSSDAASRVRRRHVHRARAARGERVTVRRLAARFAAKEAFLKAWSGSRCGAAAAAGRRRPARDRGRRRRLRAPGAPAARGTSRRAAGDVHAQVSLSHDGAGGDRGRAARRALTDLGGSPIARPGAPVYGAAHMTGDRRWW